MPLQNIGGRHRLDYDGYDRNEQFLADDVSVEMFCDISDRPSGPNTPALQTAAVELSP